MKMENAQKIVEYIKDELGGEARVYEDYMGRGMFGNVTAAVVTNDPGDVAEAMGALGIKDTRRTDTLGRDTVVY